MNHKAVIFDMNGIIIDDEHIHELAFKQLLIKFGIDLDHKNYLLCFAGRTDLNGFEEVEKQYKVTLPKEELLKQKMEIYLNLFPEHKKTYPGVIELINLLSKKFILALTTSSTRREVNLIINEFEINDKFTVIVSAEDIHSSKPDPEPYLITSQKLKISSEECIVIEDSASGVKSAISAGMKCIGITTTHTAEDLYEATKVVSDFSQITQDLIFTL